MTPTSGFKHHLWTAPICKTQWRRNFAYKELNFKHFFIIFFTRSVKMEKVTFLIIWLGFWDALSCDTTLTKTFLLNEINTLLFLVEKFHKSFFLRLLTSFQMFSIIACLVSTAMRNEKHRFDWTVLKMEQKQLVCFTFEGLAALTINTVKFARLELKEAVMNEPGAMPTSMKTAMFWAKLSMGRVPQKHTGRNSCPHRNPCT